MVAQVRHKIKRRHIPPNDFTVPLGLRCYRFADPPGSSYDAPKLESSSGKVTSDMRHVLSALVQNQPGVLAHISGMLASRGFNIDSLAVGETDVPDLSRMTFVIHGDDAELEQVRKQLDKIVTVVRVDDISSENFIERDLMLIKVNATPAQRVEISLMVEMFRGRVVDISLDSLIVEISGTENKVEAFIDLMRPYGIIELARTGRIALVRGNKGAKPS